MDQVKKQLKLDEMKPNVSYVVNIDIPIGGILDPIKVYVKKTEGFIEVSLSPD